MGSLMNRIEKLDDKIDNIPSNTRWYIFGIFTVFSWLMGLLLLYSFHKFGKLSKLDIIKKRYPVIIKLECIFCSILCIIVLPIMVINSSKLIVSTKYANIINLSHVILTPLVSHGIANLEACRCWLMYFKMNYLFENENKEWKTIINGNHDDNNNFWIKYKKTYGNARWMSSRFFIYYVLANGIQITMTIMYGSSFITQLQDAIVFEVPVGLVIILWFRCPNIRHMDKFLFYYEFTITAVFYMFGLTSYTCNVVLWYFSSYWGGITTPIIGLLGLCSVSLLSILVIPKKIISLSIWAAILHNNDDRKMSETVENEAKTDENDNSTKFNIIFQSEIVLEMFVRFLLKEYCQENLIAYIEFKQFRDIFKIKSYMNDNHETKTYLFQLPPNNPESKIVYNRFNINGTYTSSQLKYLSKLIFIDFYNKYIDSYSTYGVNISYEIRSHYDDIYKNTNTDINDETWCLELNEILTLYDPILKTMIKILHDSKFRFLKSQEYLEYSV